MRERSALIWILIDRVPTPAKDVLEWADWMENNDKTVRKDVVHGVEISTIFLGFDGGHGLTPQPLFFETMMFTEVDVLPFQTRYPSWEAAEQGHQLIVEHLRSQLPTLPVEP